MRVKICGITSLSDALAAAEAGADAIGLNLVSGPRKLSLQAATQIVKGLPPMVTAVALVRAEDGRIPADVSASLDQCRITHFQLYGTMSARDADDLASRGFVLMPVVTVRDRDFPQQARAHLEAAHRRSIAAFLLDTHHPDMIGGTGTAFHWDWVTEARAVGQLADWPPIILAGGLRPENVSEAIRIVRPYAVDVCSGVEVDGCPGRKDPARMRKFVSEARAALVEGKSRT